MSDIPSANQKIQVEATQYLRPTSESLMQSMGGSINYSLDQVAANASSISTIGSKTPITTTRSGVTGVLGDPTAPYSYPATATLTFDKNIDQLIVISVKAWNWGGAYTDNAVYSVKLTNSDFFSSALITSATLLAGTVLYPGTPVTAPGYATVFLPGGVNSANWAIEFSVSSQSGTPVAVPGIGYEVRQLSLASVALLP